MKTVNRSERKNLQQGTRPAVLTENEPLSKHCTLRVGGPAQYWADVENIEQLEDLAVWARLNSEPMTILGLGSNVLINDSVIKGVVVRLSGDFADLQIPHNINKLSPGDDAYVKVGAGVVNAHLVRKLLAQRLLGAEFLALIPGTMGGAVVMNAGIKEKDLGSILREVTIFDPTTGEVKSLPAQSFEISYRHTELPPNAVVVSASIVLKVGTDVDVEEAREFVKSQKEMRNRTQPYKLASVGSTFRNPPGDHAGRLIEACGLKGTRVGHAVVSEAHANFFINEGGATAADFANLIRLVQRKVYDAEKIVLQPEVRWIGFDEDESEHHLSD